MILNFENAQILEQYPRYQVPYLGNYESYYKDFHDIIIEKKLKPCADKSEFYQFKLLINADKSVSFIKDFSEKILLKTNVLITLREK